MVLRIRGNPTWDRRNQRWGTGKRMQLCYSSEGAFSGTARYVNELTTYTLAFDTGANVCPSTIFESRGPEKCLTNEISNCLVRTNSEQYESPILGEEFRYGLNYLPIDGCTLDGSFPRKDQIEIVEMTVGEGQTSFPRRYAWRSNQKGDRNVNKQTNRIHIPFSDYLVISNARKRSLTGSS